MKTLCGDIWSLAAAQPNSALVVPTNIGWTRGGENPMGRGVALEAMRREPTLARWYGALCKRNGAQTQVVLWRESLTFILFPTKPLNIKAPQLSWRNPASLTLIERSLLQLSLLPLDDGTHVFLPLVGCGNGGLSEDAVMPLLHKYLNDRFTLVVEER